MRSAVIITLIATAPAVLSAPLSSYATSQSAHNYPEPVSGSFAPEAAHLRARANGQWTKAIGTAGGIMQAINAAVTVGNTIKSMIKSRSDLEDLLAGTISDGTMHRERRDEIDSLAIYRRTPDDELAAHIYNALMSRELSSSLDDLL